MAAAAWTPGRFDDYQSHFPKTADLQLPSPAETRAFERAWRALDDRENTLLRRLAGILEGAEVILVRGFLGNWMPGNFSGVARGLRALGANAWIVRSSPRHGVSDNGRKLRHRVLKRTRGQTARPLFWFGHSKGALECLMAHYHPALAARTRAILMAQAPHGPSPVIESMLLGSNRATLPTGRRRLAERSQRLALTLTGARGGGLALTSRAQAALQDEILPILAAAREFPILQTATWSDRPTTWLDSFHERLGEIEPGVAHDGQFYLRDLLWPGLPHILLDRVDHAQPAMGGLGFDPLRYWLATLAVALNLES
jgi:hypothetical protein